MIDVYFPLLDRPKQVFLIGQQLTNNITQNPESLYLVAVLSSHEAMMLCTQRRSLEDASWKVIQLGLEVV